MDNENIKEILDYLKENDDKDIFGYVKDKILSYEEANTILDYITNLQEKSNNQAEEINRLVKQREKFMKKYGYLKEENEKLKEDIEILTSDDDDSWWLESENM